MAYRWTKQDLQTVDNITFIQSILQEKRRTPYTHIDNKLVQCWRVLEDLKTALYFDNENKYDEIEKALQDLRSK